MNPGFAGHRTGVESALLDFQRTPGHYPVLLRRPEVLFASIKQILQLASGRGPDASTAPRSAVQRAAAFFIHSALLHPAADHYALLGLDRAADAAAIKQRYREMIRLMHPDFADSGSGGGWPSDAASRINQAYEVLSSITQRREYDEQLTDVAAPVAHRTTATQSAAQLKAGASRGAPQDPRNLLKRIAGAFGILAAMATTAALLASGPDRESLVQRAPAPVAAAKLDTGPLPRAAVLIEPAQATARLPAELPEPQQPALRTEPLPQSLPAIDKAPRTITTAAGAPALSVREAPPDAMRAFSGVPSAGLLTVSTDVAVNSAGSALTAPAIVVQAAPLAPVTPSPAPARPSPAPSVTVAEAHALLSTWLQQLETGSGERLFSGLDRGARNAPGAQLLLRQYNALVEGARSVKVAGVQLRSEAREDRLLLRGQVLLEIGDSTVIRPRELPLEAEFARRNGVIVITRLALAQGPGGAAQ